MKPHYRLTFYLETGGVHCGNHVHMHRAGPMKTQQHRTSACAILVRSLHCRLGCRYTANGGSTSVCQYPLRSHGQARQCLSNKHDCMHDGCIELPLRSCIIMCKHLCSSVNTAICIREGFPTGTELQICSTPKCG